MTISENIKHFQYLYKFFCKFYNFETDFLENKTFFKKLEYCFFVERTKIEKASFPKLPYQKPMLIQIEWWLQNGPITENEVLPVW